MIVAIKVEYEGESVNVALYEGIEVEEFTDVILNSLHINGTIIGLKDTNGVILLPKFICQNVSQIQQTTYELIVKTKDQRVSSPATIPKKIESKPYPPRAPPAAPTPKREPAPDIDLFQMLRFLRMDGFLTEQEEKTILEMSRCNNTDLLAAQQLYQKTGDFNGFKTKLKQLSVRKQWYPPVAWQENARPGTGTGYRTRRPLSAAKWTENANINSTQAMLIGAVHDLEEKKLLDEQVVCTIKTLILEENPEVIKLLNSYIAHMIDERELCPRLQRLSDRMSTYIERPSSPFPRKSSLLEFVNNIAATYMRGREDIAILQRLIEDENEFVISAFDVFESDKDQENLLDTLLRIVAKFKRMGISKDSVTAAAFYDGGILRPAERPETRGQTRAMGNGMKIKRGDFQPFSSESDSCVPGNEFHFQGEPREQEDKSEDDEPEAEAVNLPNAGLVYVTRSKNMKIQDEDTAKEDEPVEIPEPTFKDFEQTGILEELRDELVGTLKWALRNSEVTLRGAYETYKLTNDPKLFLNTVSTICGKIFENALAENLTKDQLAAYRERRKRRNGPIMKLLEELRKTGNLMEFMNELRRTVKIPEEKPRVEEKPPTMLRLFEARDISKEEAKAQQIQEESNDEATEKELVGDILNTLETEARISREDISALEDLYRQGSKDVMNALQEFKKDHDLIMLGDRLSPLVKRKHKNEAEKKKKKKKKFKTFEECIEFFKVSSLITQKIEQGKIGRRPRRTLSSYVQSAEPHPPRLFRGLPKGQQPQFLVGDTSNLLPPLARAKLAE
eukprot:TRINITY_DN153_c0_g1_i2.p1 TRINITY_DN153_c0_g1~~TRINITY_DN153_c0_g1_i2.p1  ORF type:complete len:790 (-),score=106.37 TRINITY_DN153_c0_g1_i2:12035-14404(-)